MTELEMFMMLPYPYCYFLSGYLSYPLQAQQDVKSST